MNSRPSLLEWLEHGVQASLHFYLTKVSTTGLRHGSSKSGADHIGAKINLNGKKSLLEGSNFFLGLSPEMFF